MNRKKILILRPDNIGDVVLFTGALRHIRNLYPKAHITLAVQAHIVNLVELCPYVDACVPVDRLTWWGRIEHTKFRLKYKHRIEQAIHAVNKLWNSMSKPFDVLIYPVKSSYIPHLEIIYRLNAPKTFGITGCSLRLPKSGCPSRLQPDTLFTSYLDVSKADPWIHELHTTVAFLLWSGCSEATPDAIKPQFWLAESEKNYLDGVQRNGRKIIGLFPGGSFKGKSWESCNYGELAKLLGGRAIYAIFGSSADKDLSEQVAFSIRERSAEAEILNLTGKTTLRELAKTILSCDLLISMDTSGLHMSIAAGVPAIGIVGGWHFGRFVPWGDSEKNVFLTKKMDCFHCKGRCIKKEAECVQGVSPQEVALAAAKLLKQVNPHEQRFC